MASASKPNVLVFGGLDLFATILVQQLIPPSPAEPLVAHIRILDKYSVNPPTTYLSKPFLTILKDRSDLVEYRQANLANAATVEKAFTDPAPNGLPYTHIIDSTGELFPERPAAVYVANTFNVALSIARFAASQLVRHPGSVKAYVRIVPPFYQHTDGKKRYKEEDADGWRPKDLRCVWWHEMVRAVGSVEGLPLVVLRSGLLYGEGWCRFEIVGTILLGLVYKHLGQDMKLLWSPKLPKNSLNVHDFAMVVWKAAEWVSTKSRSEVLTLAGVPLPPTKDDSVTSEDAPGVIPASAGLVNVPVFNVVDESDTTQESLGEVISGVYGINVGFQGVLSGLLAKMKLGEITEEANQVHVEAWNEIILNSKPPVPSTPLSPYLPIHFLREHGCALDGTKVKTILNVEYKYPRFDARAVMDYIGWCQAEGIWPETGLI